MTLQPSLAATSFLFCVGISAGQLAAPDNSRGEKEPSVRARTTLSRADAGRANRKTAGNERKAPSFVKVSAAAFSPDNKYLLLGYTGAGKKTVTLWKVTTAKEVCSLPGHTYSVWGVAFVAEGKRALSANGHGYLMLHEVPSGKLLVRRKATGGLPNTLTVSRDGTQALTFAYGAGGLLRLWAVDDLKLLRSFAERVRVGSHIALSPDHRWALSCSPPRLWNLKTGKQVRSLEGEEWRGGDVAAFSPDSRLALVRKTITLNDKPAGRIALWDVATGNVVRVFEGDARGPATFTQDGKQAVSTFLAEPRKRGGPWEVRMTFWEVASGRLARTVVILQPGEEYPELYLSGDGRRLLVAAGGVWEGPSDNVPRDSTLRLAVWDLETGREVQRWIRPRADR
jgi:WD40 repeat protein